MMAMLNQLMPAGFPFPIALTMWHMGFSGLLAFACVRLGYVPSVNMSRETYMKAILPIGALFAGTLWLGNAAYLYLSVSFIQMLKALMPVAVFIVGCGFKTESYSSEPHTDPHSNVLSLLARGRPSATTRVHSAGEPPALLRLFCGKALGRQERSCTRTAHHVIPATGSFIAFLAGTTSHAQLAAEVHASEL